MADLLKMICVPCENDTPPLTESEIEAYQKVIPNWGVIDDAQGVPRLTRTFKFNNFVEALAFTNAVGAAAEAAGHHPLIELTWGRVTVQWWTHNINELHQNDFIMAARTDQIYSEEN